MNTKNPNKLPHKNNEKSFSLLEIIVAIGILATITLNVSTIQGNAVMFSDYQRKSSQAIWLLKALMSQVEYKSKLYDFKEVSIDVKDQEFDEKLCPKDPSFGCDYKYTLKIETWKLPLIELITSGMGDLGPLMQDQLKNILGDEQLKVAHAEVSWPEGARRSSIETALLLTNQKTIDEQIASLQDGAGLASGASGGSSGGGTSTNPSSTTGSPSSKPATSIPSKP